MVGGDLGYRSENPAEGLEMAEIESLKQSLLADNVPGFLHKRSPKMGTSFLFCFMPFLALSCARPERRVIQRSRVLYLASALTHVPEELEENEE